MATLIMQPRSEYGGVPQRWLMFFSEAAYQRENKTLDRAIKKAGVEQNKAWYHLINQMFTCPTDAYQSSRISEKKTLKFHDVITHIVEVKKHKGKGRPKAAVLPEIIGYKIEYTLSLNEEKVAAITC